MIRSTLAIAAILSGAALVGCDSKSDNSAAPAPAAAPTKPQADANAPAMPSTPALPATPAPMTSPTAAGTPAATPDMPMASATADADAQSQISQVLDYIKQNKLDLADQSLTKIEGMKSSLSPAMQAQVDNARKALNSAKAMGGVKAPEMPAMPK